MSEVQWLKGFLKIELETEGIQLPIDNCCKGSEVCKMIEENLGKAMYLRLIFKFSDFLRRGRGRIIVE